MPFNVFGSQPLFPSLVSHNVTLNQTNLRSWFRRHEHADFPFTESMVKYVARVLDQSKANVGQLTNLTISEYDPSVHEFDCSDTRKKYYYVLWGQFSDGVIPAPTRACTALGIEEIVHVQLCHATSVGGITGILTDKAIGPSRLQFDFSKSFFSLGSKQANDKSWEALELSRLIHNGWHSSKNASNLLVVAIGWEVVKLYDLAEKNNVSVVQLVEDASTTKMAECGSQMLTRTKSPVLYLVFTRQIQQIKSNSLFVQLEFLHESQPLLCKNEIPKQLHFCV